MNKIAVIIISVIVVFLLGIGGFVFFASQAEDESAGSAPDTANVSEQLDIDDSAANPAGTSPTGAADAGAGDTTDTPSLPSEQNANYTIDMFNFGFSIDQIKAKPGDTLTVELTNSGGTHNFVIDELGVRSDTINNGGKTLVTFTIPADAAGETYEFYCSISNHHAQGMVGQLVISQ